MADTPLFDLGTVVATPAALKAIGHGGEIPETFLERHKTGDWGDLDREDRQMNDLAVKAGSRVLSAYDLTGGTKIWVITEADRSATTILLPEEY